MKVVLLDSQIIKGYDYSIEQKIVEDAGFTFVKETCKNEEEVIERCSDADGILNITIKMTEKSISQLKNCQVMVRYGIGVNEFDIPAATKMGIKIANDSAYCIPEVAIHATSLILAMSRNLKFYDKAVHDGVWNQRPGTMEKRPSAQTVGLVGFGNISQQVAKNLKGMDYRVIAYDPYQKPEVFEEKGVQAVSLEELYAQANIISLHCPETADTHHMLNAETFAKLNDGVIIVNCSRGGLINEEDLVKALDEGKVAAAGLDVMAVEPMMDQGHPLLNRDNVLITPHFAYRSMQANMELFKNVASTAVAVLKGEDEGLTNILNKKDLKK
jgi:D-3-phosphoglycerate dehydrogenase